MTRKKRRQKKNNISSSNKEIYLQDKKTPLSFVGWLFCIFSMFCAALFFLFFMLGAREIQHHLSFANLKQSIAINDWFRTKELFQDMTAQSGIIDNAYLMLLPAQTEMVTERINHAQGIFDILEHVKQLRIYEAESQLPKEKDFLQRLSSAAAQEGWEEPAFHYKKQLFEHIEASFGEHAIKQQETKRIKDAISDLEADAFRSIERFQLVANDFGEFFSLAPMKIQMNLEGLNFYKAGVLEFLPVLEKLPDGIQSLSELKDEIEYAHGKVQVSGENAYEEFNDKLMSLQTTSAGLITAYDISLTELEDQKELMQKKKKALNKIRASLNNDLEKLLISSLEPKHSYLSLLTSGQIITSF